MRLFIAAELPDTVLDALAETQAELRSCVRGRYVGADSFHVTLAFLGNVESARVACVERALDRACVGHGPSRVALGELGSFGKRAKSTLWQGFSDAGDLPGLARDVRSELAGEGVEFDAKTFLPHVTLMRAADLSGGVLPMPCLAEGEIEVVTLFRSDLSGSRPVYEPLHRAHLG